MLWWSHGTRRLNDYCYDSYSRLALVLSSHDEQRYQDTLSCAWLVNILDAQSCLPVVLKRAVTTALKHSTNIAPDAQRWSLCSTSNSRTTLKQVTYAVPAQDSTRPAKLKRASYFGSLTQPLPKHTNHEHPRIEYRPSDDRHARQQPLWATFVESPVVSRLRNEASLVLTCGVMMAPSLF